MSLKDDMNRLQNFKSERPVELDKTPRLYYDGDSGKHKIFYPDKKESKEAVVVELDALKEILEAADGQAPEIIMDMISKSSFKGR